MGLANLLHLFKILLEQQWMNYQQKLDQKKYIKLIDQNCTEGLEKESALVAALMFTNGLENYQNQKQDGPQVRINIWGPTILSNNN